MNYLSIQRLVDDVLECHGDLDSISSPPRGGEVDGMSSVGRCEVGRTSTWRLLKGGVMLIVKS
jgi:hypothetical protein